MLISPQEFWSRVAWGRPDSPPRSLCSFCAAKLPEVPLMMWKPDGSGAAFCDPCAEKVIEFSKAVRKA